MSALIPLLAIVWLASKKKKPAATVGDDASTTPQSSSPPVAPPPAASQNMAITQGAPYWTDPPADLTVAPVGLARSGWFGRTAGAPIGDYQQVGRFWFKLSDLTPSSAPVPAARQQQTPGQPNAPVSSSTAAQASPQALAPTTQGDDAPYRAPEECPDGYHWEKHGSLLVCTPDVSGDDTDRIHRYGVADPGQFADIIDSLHEAGFDCQAESPAAYNCFHSGQRQLRIVHDAGDDTVVAQQVASESLPGLWTVVDPIVHEHLSG